MLSGRGRSCQSGGRREKERGRAQQRALTTAGVFFFFPAARFLPASFLDFFPPAERQKRVGPLSCSRDSSDSGSGCSSFGSSRRGSNAWSPLEVIASKPCWVAGCDGTPAGRRTEPRSRTLRPHCPAFPLRHGLSRRPPRRASPGSARGLRAAAASGRGASQTPSPRNSRMLCLSPSVSRCRLRSQDLCRRLPQAFAAGNRGTLQTLSQ